MMASMVRLRAKVAPRRPGALGIRWGAGSHLYHTAAPGKVRERGKRRGLRKHPQRTTDSAPASSTPTARALGRTVPGLGLKPRHSREIAKWSTKVEVRG